MARSGGLPLGSPAPHFELPEPLTDKVWKLEDFESHSGLLVMFLCNHCPFVKHLKKDIATLAHNYKEKGVAVVAISSNSEVTYPQDGPQFMAEDAKTFDYPFPYLYDKSQDIARAFQAVCTPEFFLFKKDEGKPFELFYHGQFDDSRPGNKVPVTGSDLSLAVDCLLGGKPFPNPQRPSFPKGFPVGRGEGLGSRVRSKSYMRERDKRELGIKELGPVNRKRYWMQYQVAPLKAVADGMQYQVAMKSVADVPNSG